MKLINQILKTIERYEMLKGKEKVLIGVSGGSDSVFLLHVLNQFKKKLGIQLVVAHIDHGVRGKDSRDDAKFVKRLVLELGLKGCFKKLKPQKKNKLSLEEALREERYKFFKEICKKYRIKTVLTGHTLDDQAETVLMRIIKGTSLKGLMGIHPVRVDGSLRFVRPLVEIEKKDILDHLKKEKIKYCTDKTNFDNKFLRNHIRNEILPYLLSVNPRMKRSLNNMVEALREDFIFIEQEKHRKKYMLKKNKGEVRILLKDILLQPKAIQRELVREAIKSTGASVKKLTYRHWKDVDSFMRKTPKNKSLDLPGGVKIFKGENYINFFKSAN